MYKEWSEFKYFKLYKNLGHASSVPLYTKMEWRFFLSPSLCMAASLIRLRAIILPEDLTRGPQKHHFDANHNHSWMLSKQVPNVQG